MASLKATSMTMGSRKNDLGRSSVDLSRGSVDLARNSLSRISKVFSFFPKTGKKASEYEREDTAKDRKGPRPQGLKALHNTSHLAWKLTQLGAKVVADSASSLVRDSRALLAESLRPAESQEQQDFKFLTMLAECEYPEVTPTSSWEEVKPRVKGRPEYRAVPRKRRELLFNAYLEALREQEEEGLEPQAAASHEIRGGTELDHVDDQDVAFLTLLATCLDCEGMITWDTTWEERASILNRTPEARALPEERKALLFRSFTEALLDHELSKAAGGSQEMEETRGAASNVTGAHVYTGWEAVVGASESWTSGMPKVFQEFQMNMIEVQEMGNGLAGALSGGVAVLSHMSRSASDHLQGTLVEVMAHTAPMIRPLPEGYSLRGDKEVQKLGGLLQRYVRDQGLAITERLASITGGSWASVGPTRNVVYSVEAAKIKVPQADAGRKFNPSFVGYQGEHHQGQVLGDTVDGVPVFALHGIKEDWRETGQPRDPQLETPGSRPLSIPPKGVEAPHKQSTQILGDTDLLAELKKMQADAQVAGHGFATQTQRSPAMRAAAARAVASGTAKVRYCQTMDKQKSEVPLDQPTGVSPSQPQVTNHAAATSAGRAGRGRFNPSFQEFSHGIEGANLNNIRDDDLISELKQFHIQKGNGEGKVVVKATIRDDNLMGELRQLQGTRTPEGKGTPQRSIRDDDLVAELKKLQTAKKSKVMITQIQQTNKSGEDKVSTSHLLQADSAPLSSPSVQPLAEPQPAGTCGTVLKVRAPLATIKEDEVQAGGQGPVQPPANFSKQAVRLAMRELNLAPLRCVHRTRGSKPQVPQGGASKVEAAQPADPYHQYYMMRQRKQSLGAKLVELASRMVRGRRGWGGGSTTRPTVGDILPHNRQHICRYGQYDSYEHADPPPRLNLGPVSPSLGQITDEPPS